MRLLGLPSLVLSLALLGSSNAIAAQPDQNVQHLTCTRDPQGLMCTIDQSQEAVALKQSAISQNQGIRSEQLEQISNALIGLIFIGLPIGLILAVIIHDKRDSDRTKQVEQLERIWQQN